jgi:hypothetical protein
MRQRWAGGHDPVGVKKGAVETGRKDASWRARIKHNPRHNGALGRFASGEPAEGSLNTVQHTGGIMAQAGCLLLILCGLYGLY